MKKNIKYLIPFILGICCFITYNIIGIEIAADGMLIEPFFLIPIGYILIFIGMCLLIFKLVLTYKKKS